MRALSWPYKRHAGVFAGTQQYAQEHGWESIVDEFADDRLPAAPGSPIPYDGVIARATPKLALRAARLKIPVVNVWLSSPARKNLPGVYPDYSDIGRMRAEHLLARGFRRFATLTSKHNRGHAVEMQAFSAEVSEAGCSCLSETIPLSISATLKQARTAERKIAAWMNAWNPPVGVFVGDEAYGRIVAQMCRYRGWRVPQDVAIIAGANEETICEHLRPTLTSVEIGFERIGYEAARLLDRLMAGGSPPAEPILLPAQSLVVRESTDFFAVDDELIAKALAYIATRSHQEIGPDDVADAVNMHTRTLQRHFHKLLGRPIATEIRRVRIERAKRELSQSNRPLAQIARDVPAAAGKGHAGAHRRRWR
ncbi:MAG TPA: substrate-binding domain-containing protein [Planctomycetota bacterium]|nr:substrate-binding domain-containing protein [Planctomycetota bacterium]